MDENDNNNVERVAFRFTYIFDHCHYNDAIMSSMAFQITSLTVVHLTVYFRRRSKKKLKLRVIGLCEGNSPVTGEFHAQRASNPENAYIWWRHHSQHWDRTGCWNISHIKTYYVSSREIFRYQRMNDEDHQRNTYIDGLVQGCNIFIVNAMEIQQSCTKPSIW